MNLADLRAMLVESGASGSVLNQGRLDDPPSFRVVLDGDNLLVAIESASYDPFEGSNEAVAGLVERAKAANHVVGDQCMNSGWAIATRYAVLS